MEYKVGELLLKLEGISLNYGSKKILRDINLEIRDIQGTTTIGQVVTLLGRSGIGKSQLMKIIAGLVKPTAGSVFVGKEQTPVIAGVVGVVLQEYPLFPHRTLMDNLLLANHDKAKIESYLEDFDIYQHKDKYPKELSGGQRQRTALLQQILCSEHFVLLDEPFSGLDPIAIDKLCKILNKIANYNSENTIIISSHILEPALAISDAVWMLGNEYEGERKVEGAVVRYTEDLASQGLSWNPEIRKDKRFFELVEKIRDAFYTL